MGFKKKVRGVVKKNRTFQIRRGGGGSRGNSGKEKFVFGRGGVTNLGNPRLRRRKKLGEKRGWGERKSIGKGRQGPRGVF